MKDSPGAMTAKTDGDALTPLQRAFIALEDARARLAATRDAQHAPIAVIGVGCRVPGGGDDADRFWALMRDGVDAIGRVPADRWDIDAYFDPDPEAPGRIATREGGFISGVDRFDPAFFGIAPREAQGMDPQQRLLLEVVWEALEAAGQAPDRLRQSATGVFVGAASCDYTYLQVQSGDPALYDAHFASGIAHSVFSGRLSYLLGLQGPSVTIDTACSSSLVAVHLAVQSLRRGESRMAIAGGVNLMLAPDLYIALSRSRMLAPDGRCKTFDASADGFARGEGCAAVVLKRLADAQADGDRVLAVIRGSAVNQDGPSSSLTAPNGPAQEAVIRAALADARLEPRQIGYVEAHGTGTQLGDPLEVHALGAVFGADRAGVPPLVIGSVKTNIGHLEGAAGVVGLIKLVLALGHRTIPKHLHFRTPSPHIAWSELPLQVPADAMPWRPIEGRRIAGVSSFGFSGTNAHVVVEEAPEPVATGRRAPGPCLFTVSAATATALARLAGRHADAVAGWSDDRLEEACRTANAGRAHHAHRAAVVAGSIGELVEGLRTIERGEDGAEVWRALLARRDPPRIAFLYTGQGAQYAGMARGLYEAVPAFRAALDRCAAALAPHLPAPLLEVMFGADGAALDETRYTQPALFALEYALTQAWREWGVVPSIVMGHSVGEIVAACVAGVMSLDDASRIVARRGALMQALPPGGAMAAIGAPEVEVARAIEGLGGRISIAAINDPTQTVVSGDGAAVDALCVRFERAGARIQRLPVSHAFHSPLVEPMLDAFERELASASLQPPRIRMISNLTGAVMGRDDPTHPAYWRRHVREAVRFADGVAALLALRPDVVVEVGPNPTLLGFVSAIAGAGGPIQVASLRKGRDDARQLLGALGRLHLSGVSVDWRRVHADEGGRLPALATLPGYPFERERHWFEARAPRAGARPAASAHPLLGARVRSATAQVVHEAWIGADAPSFVRQHRVQDRVILPATAYLEALRAAGRGMLGSDAFAIEDVVVREAMLLDDDGAARCMQTVVEPVRDGAHGVSVSSQPDDAAPWSLHLSATLRPGPTPAIAADLDAIRARCRRPLGLEDFYATFERRGLEFGAGFRSIRELALGDREALGRVELASREADADAGIYDVHPVLLDGALQVMAAAMPADDPPDVLYLPIGIARYVLLRRPGASLWSHARVRADGGDGDTRRADLSLFDDAGHPVGELRDLQLKRVTRDTLARLGERWVDDVLYEVRWTAGQAGPGPGADAPTWSPRALAEHAAGARDGLAAAAGLADYDRFLPRFDALCADHVLAAFAALGWRPTAGDEIEAGPLADRLGVLGSHRRLFGRLLAILAEVGLLRPRAQGGWIVPAALPAADPAAGLAALRRECPEGASHELELTARVAASMAPALRGEVDPMQLLFPDGSLDATERMYRDSPTARFYNGLVARVVEAAVASAGGRPLRILEIGGGTGGTTAHVLPVLPDGGFAYTFTDIGPLFVERAKARFGSGGDVSCEVLDIERDPATQGFAGRRFDLVLASNVVHATADLRRTLRHLRSLMAPGAVLAMLEVTAPQRWFDLTVGLTPGWWAFSDGDLRADYATLPRERWLSLLEDCGFDEPQSLPGDPSPGGCVALQSVFVARSRRDPASTTLLVGDARGTAEAIAERRRASGARCVVVGQGAFSRAGDGATLDRASRSAWRRLLDGLRDDGLRIDAVVDARGLDVSERDAPESGPDGEAAGATISGALALAQALAQDAAPPRLWYLTRGAQPAAGDESCRAPSAAPVWGLVRTLALEHPELRASCVDLDPGAGPRDLDPWLGDIEGDVTERQIAWRAATRLVARLDRLRPGTPASERPASWRMEPRTPGSLDGFEFRSTERRVPKPGEVEIEVEATGLNFKDVLNVLGMYPGDPGPLGGECAGRVTAVGAGVAHLRVGQPVMAVAGGSFASHVIARAELVQPRPAGLGAEEGASVSIPYLTAAFCLEHLARLKPGESVLVHAAAGGVGMAAVRVAQRAGARVFATAGAAWKRALLRRCGVAHVYDSRSTAFADAVRAATDGRGVDVVLNALSGDALEASFAAIADRGRFVEIGKRDIKTRGWVDALGRGIDYHVVDWGETAAADPQLIRRLYADVVEGLRDGTLPALPRQVFGLEEAARAFRLMAQARHAGKVVVRHAGAASWTPRRDGTYLITGGLSGLGLQVARWLAARGAGRLVLAGRRGRTDEASAVLDELARAGASVEAVAIDVTDVGALEGLLGRIRDSGPPLRGVWHSAGVLDDAALLQQDEVRFAHVMGPKVTGAAALDALTRADPIDAFVLFSSVAGVLGSPGQSNHAAANAFLASLAHARAAQGLPALCIDWGAWSEVGAAADGRVATRLAAQGIGTLTPVQGLRVMERLIESRTVQAAVVQIDWSRYAGERGAASAYLREVASPRTAVRPGASQAPGARDAAPDLAARVAAAPAPRRRAIVLGAVRDLALKALGMDPTRTIDPRVALREIGLDSLLAVELRNTLAGVVGRPLPATLLFDHPSIDALTDHLLDEVVAPDDRAAGTPAPAGGPVAAATTGPEPVAPPSGALVGDIESMSDEDVERLLAKRHQSKARTP